MNYQNAKKRQAESQKMIGSKDEKGFVIGDIIIVPSSPKDQSDFFRSYIFNHDASKSILPYLDSDLEVWAIDTIQLIQANILFYRKL